MKQKYLVRCKSCDIQISKYVETGKCRVCYLKNPHKYWLNKKRDAKTLEAMKATQFKKGKGFWTGKKRGPQSSDWVAKRIRRGKEHHAYVHGESGTIAYNTKLQKRRMDIDPLFKLHARIQQYTSHAFHKTGGRGSLRTVEILGADIPTVKAHIESQFKQGMGWDNYGKYGWHIDHIIPVSSARTFEETLELCRYTNLQPLWAHENLVKSDRFISYPWGVSIV